MRQQHPRLSCKPRDSEHEKGFERPPERSSVCKFKVSGGCVTGVADSCVVHTAEVNCLGFNPFNEYVLATGSADKTVSKDFIAQSDCKDAWSSKVFKTEKNIHLAS